MYNKIILSLCICFFSVFAAVAQNAPRYGFVSRTAIIESLNETARARQQLDTLRARYEQETRYNETNFRRQFSEFLQTQKSLPEAILLKRQSDLQLSMERSLAFRRQAEDLLKKAEKELFDNIEKRVDEAIRAVGAERGYDCVINIDANTHPYFNPQISEDATNFVKARLSAK